MKKLRCKCVKGLDGFTLEKVYNVEFVGKEWWAVNDDGKIVSGASESFDPIEGPISEELEEASKEWLALQLNKSYANYGETKMMELTHFDGYAMLDAIEFGAKWKEEQMLKSAIKTEVCERITQKGLLPSVTVLANGFKVYDKVKVIIIKDD